MSFHAFYKYSITIHTDDLAVVNCLRSLAKFSQKEGNTNIPWGGTTNKNWESNGHRVTFRFTAAQYRDGFVGEMERLLPKSLWKVVAKRDDDPATPQH